MSRHLDTLKQYQYPLGKLVYVFTSIVLIFLAQPTTFIPNSVNCFAVVYPIPAEAPVTSATLPLHLSIPG